METALIIMATGFLCVACFVLGAKVGQKVSKGEDIELPAVNPAEAFRKMEARKEARAEQSRMETIMSNIETYDGTSVGQREVR
jgi:hypothetical protein